MKKRYITFFFVILFCYLTISAQTIYLSAHFKSAQEAHNHFKKNKPTILWDLHGVLFDKPFFSIVTHGIWNISNKPKFIFEFCKSAFNSTVRNNILFQWNRGSKVTQSYFDAVKDYDHMHNELIKLANNMYVPNPLTYQNVTTLQKMAYNQYIFSNIGPEALMDLQTTYPECFIQFNQLKNTINPITPDADKWINKPDAQAYQKTLETINYQETPWLTLFIDDKEENIKKAQELGMNGILFITPEQLHNDLTRLLSL